jgi:carbonic anhydrase
MISALESLRRLRDGNARFASNVRGIARDGLLVVGAEYFVETGLVDFFDGVPTGT